MANTTWNPSDKSASVTLSNLNLTAASSSLGNVRAIDKQVTGKFYYEVTMTTSNASSDVGLATGTAALGTSTPADPSVYVNMLGTIFVNNVSTGVQLGGRAAGDVFGIAVDMSNRLIWFRVAPSGNWNNSVTASPGTGVGGIAFTGGVGIPMFPWLYFNTANTMVANFGDTAFTGTVPSGFTSGFTAGVTSPTNALASQISAEHWLTTSPNAQITQIALEHWATVTGTGLQAVVTQVALEHWASVANVPVSVGAPMITMIG